MNLSLIRAKIGQGLLVEAQDLIDGLIKGSENKKNRYEIEILRSQLLFLMERFDQVVDQAEKLRKIITKSKNTNNVFLATWFLMASQIRQNQPGIAQQIYELFSQRAKKEFEQEKSLPLANMLLEAHLNFLKGVLEIGKSNFSQAISSLRESSKQYFTVEHHEGMARAYEMLATAHWKKGNLIEATSYFQQAHMEWETLQYKPGIVRTLQSIGAILTSKGDYSKAITYLNQNIKNLETMQHNVALAYTLNSLGTLYYYRGELESALEAFSSALQQNPANNRLKIWILNNIGLIYHAQNNYQQANSFFQKALDLAREIKDNISTSLVLHNLVVLKIDFGQKSEISELIKQLEKISKKSSDPIVMQRFLLAKALLLKASFRMVNQAEAFKIFQTIASQEISEIGLHLFAIFNLCEMLFQEYINYNSEEALKDIEKWTTKLQEFAIAQGSAFYLIQAYLIQAQLHIVNAELNQAKNILSLAQQIAEEKGLRNLSIKVSQELDELLNAQATLAETTTTLAVAERIKLARIDKLSETANIRNPIPTQEIPRETPIAFILASNTGELIMQRKFAANLSIESDLIGGFLNVLDKFAKYVFRKEEIVERLRIGEYTLLMRQIQNTYFCYVIKGASYTAVQKLELLIEALQTKITLWKNIIGSKKKPSRKNEEALNKLLDELFLQDQEAPRERKTLVKEKKEAELIEEEEEIIPHELLSYKKTFHPVKLGILKILSHHARLPASDVRQILGVPWGNFDTHLSALIRMGFIEQKTEFYEGSPRKVVYLTPEGENQYRGIKNTLRKLLADIY